MNELDLAWAAGFIDGEGCITIRTRVRPVNRRDYSLSLYVGQVDPRPLLRLQAMFGGAVVTRKTQPAERRRIRTWRVTGNAAERALVALRPYLMVKAEQADIALAFKAQVRAYVPVGRKVSGAETAERLRLMAALKADKWRVFGGYVDHLGALIDALQNVGEESA